MAFKISKNIIFYIIIVIAFFSLSCQNDVEDSENPVNFSEAKQSIDPIPGLPPEIPSYPYIFSGKFFINGNLGKENSIIISRLGNLDSPEVKTLEGEFKNLIIGPKNIDDIKNNIEFYLLLENGEMIKSKEEIPFNPVSKITNKTIDLHFEK